MIITRLPTNITCIALLSAKNRWHLEDTEPWNVRYWISTRKNRSFDSSVDEWWGNRVIWCNSEYHDQKYLSIVMAFQRRGSNYHRREIKYNFAVLKFPGGNLIHVNLFGTKLHFPTETSPRFFKEGNLSIKRGIFTSGGNIKTFLRHYLVFVNIFLSIRDHTIYDCNIHTKT